jgi:hypothetical protein
MSMRDLVKGRLAVTCGRQAVTMTLRLVDRRAKSTVGVATSKDITGLRERRGRLLVLDDSALRNGA